MKLLALIFVSVLGGPVPQYDTFEFSPTITTTAANPYFPYDPAPPSGVEPGLGATVDASYLAPGATEWTFAPCFWYQPVEEFNGALLPAGEAEWRCRFAPRVVGQWAYKVRVTDAAGTRETPVSYFDCVASSSKGFVEVSPQDHRFFEFSDGTSFLTPLVNVEQGSPFNGFKQAADSLASLGAVRFIRWFPTGEGANYHVIPWGDDIRSTWKFGGGQVKTDDTDVGEQFSFRPYYYSTQSLPVRPGNHTLSLRAHVTGEQVVRAQVGNLGHIDICSTANTLHAACDHRSDAWQSFSLDITNPNAATLTVAVRGLYVS
ncbi:MAG: hypothetical protein PVH17_11925, partial [Anaerolineae bacterium]